jgi:hypothetical protein
MTYLLYNIITWPTRKLEELLEKWHYFLWTYAHYKWGKGKGVWKRKV